MSQGYVRRRNGRWQARYRGPDHRERTKTFDRKLDAERWVTSEAASLIEGRWIDPRSSHVMFGDYAGEWMASRTNRPNTINDYERQLRNHILPSFDRRPIGSIRSTELQSWLNQLGQHLAPATVEKIWRVLVMVFRAAARDRLIGYLPTEGISAPKPQPRIIDPLTAGEIQALVTACSERYRGLIALAAGSGLRQGEIFGVTTSSLNMLRRHVVVERQLVQITSQPQWGPPKTAASVRTVPLADVTLEAIAEHRGRFEPGRDGVLFTNGNGDWIRRSSFCVMWERLVRRSALDRERVTFHELRHYYASLLIFAGSSVKAVQSRLGHATAAETLDTYGHLWPEDEEVTRAAIQAAMTGAPAVSSRSGGL